MKRLNRTSRVLVLVALAGVAASGCEKTLKMRYDPVFKRLTPVLAPGDVLEWGGGITMEHVKWGGGKSPCEDAPANATKCKIKKNLNNQHFKYKCINDKPCDPEIAIDDTFPLTPGTKGTASAAAAQADIAIDVYCTNGVLTIEPESELRVGKVVSWRPLADITGSNWTVTYDNQASACSESSPIKTSGACTLKAEGTFRYTFKSEAANCTTPKDETLYVKP